MQEVLQTESIATLTVDDLDRVATVHRIAFPESFLSGLGHATVRRYYRWLLTGPHDVIALGARCEGNLVGFAVGGVFHGALIGFLKKHCIALGWSVMLHPWLLVRVHHRRRVVAGVRTFIPFLRCEAKHSEQPWPAPKTLGILAIAVHPGHSRSGHGHRLMEAFDRIARDRKFSRMQLRVNPANEVGIAFYHKLGWTKLDDPRTGVMFKLVREWHQESGCAGN